MEIHVKKKTEQITHNKYGGFKIFVMLKYAINFIEQWSYIKVIITCTHT